MPRLPIPGSDQGSWGEILNDYLAQSLNSDGTLKSGVVAGGNIQDNTVTETKLDAAVRTKLNAGGGSTGVSSVNTRTGAVTITKADVGLSNVNDTSDASKPVSTAVQAALAGKADTGHTHTIANVTGLQAALDGKMSNGSFTLDGLTDVSATGASDGQSLVFNQGSWGPATVAAGSAAVTDATTSAKGVVQLAGDLAGTAAAPTVPGLAAKANSATTVAGATSLTGGGSLAANRTISLVNDEAAPGNSQYYGTDGSGAKGFHALPTSGASGVTSVAGRTGAVVLAAADITTGTMATARLGSGTASATTYLRGDGTWATPATGGSGGGLTAVAANATMTAANNTFIVANAATAGFTITLPAASNGGHVYIKKVDSTVNAVIIVPASGQIDGGASVVANEQWEGIDLFSDGTQWYNI